MAVARALPDYTFYFKLRPVEYQCWRDVYNPRLAEMRNIIIVDSDQVTLYEYFKKCTYVMGINSTALFEAIAAGMVALVYKGPFYEDVLDLIAAENAFLVERPDDAVRLLRDGKRPRHMQEGAARMFSAGAAERMPAVLKSIMAGEI